MASPIVRAGVAALLGALLIIPTAVFACSSCGCTLNSDWETQGYATKPGFRADLRFDYFNQNQLRTGTGTVDTGSIELPAEREIQQSTINRNYTLALDYSPDRDWGVSVLLPYYNRSHSTIAEGDTEVSTSHTESVGDVRVVGRYQGFSPDRSTGALFGVKLATGSIHNNFISGPQAGQPLDRGLQPGTGTTDLLLGAYNFGALDESWGYFAQALLQQPLNSREDFRPGTGLNVNFGVRYLAYERITPQLQLNGRFEGRESGANADVENSGASLVYLSPGATVEINKRLHVYGFFQVPVYQRVNGFQLEPRYTVSVGIHYTM
jgi:hypothetical protein